MNENKNIIKWFELLIKQLKFYNDVKTGRDKLIYAFKINSIKKSLEQIKKVKFKITKGEQLKDLKGVGKGTINRINEIIKTGKLDEVRKDDISDKHMDYIEDLIKIYGIGRTKAYELYTKYQIKSIKELKKMIKNKKIILPEVIMKGIKYVDKINTKIPRNEITQIYKYLLNMGTNYDPDMHIIICGSYRREKAFSGDIDIIITHPKLKTKKEVEKSSLLKNFITQLEKDNFIIDNFTSKHVPTKYMGICKFKNNPIRRIDIRVFSQKSYYTAILYFTGSANHNIMMRKIAIGMGYTLNEYALLNSNNKPFHIKSEKDIFTKLNLEYLTPKERI
jgi:DNA polymerase/3'-5' exonuclease PolX